MMNTDRRQREGIPGRGSVAVKAREGWAAPRGEESAGSSVLQENQVRGGAEAGRREGLTKA